MMPPFRCCYQQRFELLLLRVSNKTKTRLNNQKNYQIPEKFHNAYLLIHQYK
jgi:hypothetical protein